PAGEAALYHALVLGLRDYDNKTGFPGLLLGLSGGIDSALAAVIAADAIGADRLWTVMLPSPYTSTESLDDAASIARVLKCRFDSLHITTAMEAFGLTLAGPFASRPPGLAEENIQARCRGILLMALSNKFGPMVITTSNKSEIAVGYSTLYGDMCGGFAALKDVYKTDVYKIARWRNAHKPDGALGPDGVLIPERIFTKPPTAELRPNQTDQDSLPPYDVLDAILEGLIEQDLGMEAIVAAGHDRELVKKVWTLLDNAEYKRRQAPPGVKVTRRHLGVDRRFPMTNKYRET
ncbi:MAG: NAD(+) synthase, partial [Bdellovibrionales bacterium]